MSFVNALDLLWDKLTLAFVAGLTFLHCLFKPHFDALSAPAVQEQTNFWFAFLVLYFPCLLGNYLSIPPLAWVRKNCCKEIQLKSASLLVGVVDWFFFIPATCFLVAPTLARSMLTDEFTILQEAATLIVYLLIAEAWFYSVHRLMHSNEFLFNLVHSHHHRITDPHVYNASYQHPVEMVLITMGTCHVGSLIVPGHWITVAVHGCLICVGGNYGHAGFTNIHDDHHRRPTMGKFGFLYIADIILGSYDLHGDRDILGVAYDGAKKIISMLSAFL